MSPRSATEALALVLAICALLAGGPARAQEDNDSGGDEGVPRSTHPASDSPEVAATRARVVSAPRVPRRMQAFLIPLDERARGATARVAQGVEGVLARARQYDVVDLGRALRGDATREESERADEGRRLLAEAARAQGSGEAAAKVRGAVKQLERGLAALDVRELCEAYVRLGLALHLGGDAKGAREAFAQAALLDPRGRVDARALDAAAEQPMAVARADLGQAATGVLELAPRPAGARVLVDGELAGEAPLRLELTEGRHLVGIERAGFYPSAELLEVATRREARHAPTLQTTPGASSLNQLIAGAAGEVGRGKVGDSTQKLAGRFSLERALVGSIASHGTKVAVLLALVDATAARMVAQQSLLLAADGTDADQVEQETQAAVRKLLAQDDDAGAGSGAAAPRRPVMPGSAPPAPAPPGDDDPNLTVRDRKTAAADAPSSAGASAFAANAGARDEAPATPPEETKKKRSEKKKKGIFGKTGTEQWADDAEAN